MDIRLLAVFLEVARSRGFAQAARNLDQDPSSISRAIAALEGELGARLFQRTTRRVSLTEAGGRFAARIEPVMAELVQARDDIRSDNAAPRGRLRLGASVAFGQVCVMPEIPAFLARHPEIELELDFTDRNVDLVAEHVDLAIRLAPAVDGDVVAAKLRNTRYRVCASPDYLRSHAALKHRRDLARHRCVCFDLPAFRSRWLFRRNGRPVEEIAITPRLTVSGALALREAALSGLGPALLADWLIDSDLRAGSLIDVLPGEEVTATTFDTAAWLLYPSRSFLPRKTRVMIDFLRERLGSRR
ncbi:LysR substrate-binding domain-containing protein [Dongia sp.]|uniref:LysR family transcriptional regulator n=1 Tax=Dongia sp. TaxID=1977262 RepID=UPI0037538181